MKPVPTTIARLERLAVRLGPVRDRVVFLGGAATGLLVTDSAMPPMRPTLDVDVIVEIGNRTEYAALERELRGLGLKPDRSEGAPLCRWILDGTLLDIMPTNPELLGFSNRWYPVAMHTATPQQLPGGTLIRLIAAPAFLATKVAAFQRRGQGDFMTSHDLEDVVTVLDGRSSIVEDVRTAPMAVRTYLSETFSSFLRHPSFLASLRANLLPDAGNQARFPMLLGRCEAISQRP